MSTCLVTTVPDWFSNQCNSPEQTSQQNQAFFTALFGNFYSELGPSGIWVPGVASQNNVQPSDEQLNFQYLLGDLCSESQNGGFCSDLWTQRCQNYTRDDAEHPLVRQFCGCYLPEDQYNGLSTQLRSCDPLCSGLKTVPFFDSPTATVPQQCTTNVCVIDDVTINVINSNLGDITFQQVCTNCGPGQCRCIISDVNILAQNSNLGQLNLEENCGQATECFASINGQNQQVDCNQYLSSFGLNGTDLTTERTNTLILTIVYAVIALILIILLVFSLHRYFRTPVS